VIDEVGFQRVLAGHDPPPERQAGV
jgi:hypothetical protein